MLYHRIERIINFMKTDKKPTSKLVFSAVALLLVLLIGLLLYEFLRFKPLEPLRDESGDILSTPTNGFRYFENTPTRY